MGENDGGSAATAFHAPWPPELQKTLPDLSLDANHALLVAVNAHLEIVRRESGALVEFAAVVNAVFARL